jgi:hypothetical protein
MVKKTLSRYCPFESLFSPNGITVATVTACTYKRRVGQRGLLHQRIPSILLTRCGASFFPHNNSIFIAPKMLHCRVSQNKRIV